MVPARLLLNYLLIVAWCFVTGTAWCQDVVRVLTYNTHRAIGGPDTAQQPYLAEVVNFLNPDVWTIEELGGNTPYSRSANIAALENFVRDHLAIFGPNPVSGVNYYMYVGERSDGYICQGIISRYVLTDKITYNDNLRGLVSSIARLPSGRQLGIFVTHHKATTNSANAASDAVRRNYEAKIDAEKVGLFMSSHPGTAVVLTGDFNETEEAGERPNYPIGTVLSNGDIYHPLTTVKSAGLQDAGAVSIQGKKFTIDSFSPDARFDYVFYANASLAADTLVFDTKQYSTTQLTAINTANSTSLAPPDSQDASDHLPVLATFAIGGQVENTEAAYRIKSIGRTSADTTVSFHTGRGKIYRLERTSDLTNPNSWTTIADTIAGTGSDLSVSDQTAGTLPSAFYRLRMLP